MSCLCLAAFLMASRTWKVHAAALADADELQRRIPEEVRRDRNHYNSSDDDEARGEKEQSEDWLSIQMMRGAEKGFLQVSLGASQEFF